MKDGTKLLTSMMEIGKRWKVHLTELLNRDHHEDQSALSHPTTVKSINDPLTLEGSKIIYHQFKYTGRLQKRTVSLFKFFWGGGDQLADMYRIPMNTWNAERVPKDRRDAIMIPLYNGKAIREQCNYYRSIVLLSPTGKILIRILLSRLIAHNVPSELIGERWIRFSKRQIQKKLYQQQQGTISCPCRSYQDLRHCKQRIDVEDPETLRLSSPFHRYPVVS